MFEPYHVMKDDFAYQGNPNLTGSRDTAREAFQSFQQKMESLP
jgi:hypothetical protein